MFSNEDGETQSFLLAEQSSKYYGNNYTSCHPTANVLCNILDLGNEEDEAWAGTSSQEEI